MNPGLGRIILHSALKLWQFSPGKIQDSGLSGGVSSGAGETSGGGEVASEELLLGPDDLLRPGDVGDLEEPGCGVTVRVVGARGGGEASGELGGGGGQGQGGQGEHSGHHLSRDT